MKKANLVPKYLLSTAITMALAASPVMAGYGSSPSNDGGNGGSSAPSVCNNEVPGTPSFSFVRKSGANEIEIGWNKTDRANKWTVAYGKAPNQYIYGMSDFGDENSSSVKIGLLPPGVYYVALKASNGCMPGAFSAARKMTVTTGGQVLGAKTKRVAVLGNVLGATATPAPTPVETMAPAPSTTTSMPATPAEELSLWGKIKKFFHIN